MSKINKFREECSDYRRVRCYNPKVHVSGWHDIQNDEDYVEKYNKMRDFYSAEYPTHKMEEKYKNVKRQCKKNSSDKKIIFYQDFDTMSWLTENKRSY
ncbi:conserved Plasmodium protein, unknown function [Plasmodium ovale wallikeri]|uniref:Uncharacterized protein n=2 Tax=Plasmodium ovale TaxID=36330 RepID=A0A1A8YIZ1_PLAOA|nr:conserved Plasmodium protein, unknown function [Plasmodium ovale wallikeri]SBT31904.1 conserved Plasmodium protein, unknown function [Plasmodium ovale wallikeri]SBT75538.1 conserved Plasmodium protein, unknown function [Plasmodium ovale]